MHKLLEKVDAIELKARQLLQKMESLERENVFLAEENIKLKKEINQYIDKIEGLEKVVASRKEDSAINKEDFKQRIQALTEEVEECIKIINA
jgi:predicted RNase H-like nuclease (RuvC/YqgF family)